ncbi:MAG: hypothetical protein N4A36_03495 [Candidatus Gracilibacteria bacterium]|jgi:hypothetical protein|nr:hypothetical protein [Candidatus Gracilibacteria bacterium]
MRNLEKIIGELYELDTSLKKHDKEVRAILENIAESKPNVPFSKDFQAELKNEIVQKISDSKTESSSEEPNFLFYLFNRNYMEKLAYITAGLLVGAVPSVYYFQDNTPAMNVPDSAKYEMPKSEARTAGIEFDTKSEIITMTENAFGTIKLKKVKNTANMTNNNSRALNLNTNSAPEPLLLNSSVESLGINNATEDKEVRKILKIPPSEALMMDNIEAEEVEIKVEAAEIKGDAAEIKGGADIKIMPLFEQAEYKYVFEGDLPEIESKMAILQREKGIKVSNFIKNVDLGIIDLEKFGKLGIDSINFSEKDEKYGHNIYIDLKNSTISINKNYNKWPNLYRECKGDRKCIEKKQLKKSDIPSDKKMISLADDFLRKYNIDKSDYADPVVQKEYLNLGEEMGESLYIPEEISVLYPLRINGKQVYDQSGHQTGLSVSVNIREKKVASVYNIKINKYLSSDYETEQDEKKLRKLISEGGLDYQFISPYMRSEMKIKIKSIKVGEPELIYMLHRKYDEDDMQEGELFVPALKFDVIEKPESDPYFYKKAVMLPLIKDIIKDHKKEIEGMMEFKK